MKHMQMKLQLMSKKKKKKKDIVISNSYILVNASNIMELKLNEANSLLFKMRKHVNRKILR